MAQPREVVLRMLDSLIEDSASYGSDAMPAASMLDRAALLMARASAIVRGRRLSPSEMETLIADLFSLPDPALTPDGKKVFTLLDARRLELLLE